MKLSLASLGSSQIQNQVIKDVEDLIGICELEGLIPMFLVVGPLFVEIGCARTLRQDLKVEQWEEQVTKHNNILTPLYNDILLTTYKSCAESNGVFDSSSGSVTIYFDPDQSYIAIYAVNPEKKSSKGEASTGDGFSIEVLAFEEDDILPEFRPDKLTS